jgi:hypothetical protein
MLEAIQKLASGILRCESGGLRARCRAMVPRMLFIAISILSVNDCRLIAFAQPTPDMEKHWEAIVGPKIEAKLQQQLHNSGIVLSGRNIVMVRGQLEKNGQLKKLRLDRARCESGPSKKNFERLENAVTASVAASAPFPYESVSDSRLKHLGFFAIYSTEPTTLKVGLTQPDDYAGP